MQADEVEQVFELWDAGCIAAVGTPLREDDARRVRTVLSRYPGHNRAFCFVAVEHGTVIGFVTCAVLEHPVLLGSSGEIEELALAPGQPAQIKTALVQRAVEELKRHAVASIHTRVDLDAPQDRAFWDGLGWANDLTIFSIYRSVPGSPALEQVWNAV